MVNWQGFSLHRRQVRSEQGYWIGLMDNNMRPVCDLPVPVSIDAPRTRMAPSAAKFTFRVRDAYGVHPMVDLLIAENLARVDEQGRFIPVTDAAVFLAIEYAEGVRSVYRGVFTESSGDAVSPTMLTFHGVDELQWTLAALPCPSAPYSWTGDFSEMDRDWAVTWGKTREMASIETAKVADGFTVSGKANVTVSKLIEDSVSAAQRVHGQEIPVAVVPVDADPQSPEIVIRPTDRSIWEEIAEPALAAGLSIRASVWWPIDPQPRGMSLDSPRALIYVQQGG